MQMMPRSRATSTAAAASGIRRRRSRDYATARIPHHGAGGARLRRERRAASRVSRCSCRQRTRRRTASCTSSPRRSRCAISRSSSAASRAPKPRRSAFRPTRRTPSITRGGTSYHSLNLSVEANPRQVQRGRELADRAADIATFYESIVGDSPYPSFTVALIESDLPGGHSPGVLRGRSTSRCRRRSWPGATIRRRSAASRISSSRTSSRTSGGARRSAGATTTSSGSAKGSRSISRRCTRSTSAATRCSRGVCASCRRWAHGRVGPGTDLSRLPARPHPRREPRLPRAGLQQERGGAAHAAAPRRRRGVLPRPPPLLRRVALPARPAPRISAPRWKRKPGDRSSASSSAGSTARRCRS